MKSKEILLWVVAVAALCLSFLAIFGPRIVGVKSQAASNSITGTATTLQGPNGEVRPANGTPCIFWVVNKKGIAVQHTGVIQAGICVGEGAHGSNYVLLNNNN